MTSPIELVKWWLQILHQPGEVFEIRALDVPSGKYRHIASGYFRDYDLAAEAVLSLSLRGASGVYCTVNQLNPGVHARAADRIADNPSRTTRDEDVSVRTSLFIDIDPRRPPGVSATVQEKQAVLEVAIRIKEYLSNFGWPVPCFIDSGNGLYLAYCIHLSNDHDGYTLIRDVLASLQQQFGSDLAVIDESVANAGQIFRIPGTVNRKGDHTPDRPHRCVQVVEWPTVVECVSQKHLESVAERVRSSRTACFAPRIPPYQPFPVNALPEPVRSYVIKGAESIGCDPAYLALPALSVAAACIGNRREVRLKNDWAEPSVIWAVVVAPSGTKKSPAQAAVVEPLRTLEKEWRQYHRQKQAEFEAAVAEFKRQLADRDAAAVEPQPPVRYRVTIGDVTFEKLIRILDENPHGLLRESEELTAWISSFTRYRRSGSDVPHWLTIWSAQTLQYDRVTGNTSIMIPRAAVSVCGGIQPGILSHALASGELLDSGWFARNLLAMPAFEPALWTDAVIPPDVRTAYILCLCALLNLSMDTTLTGLPVPVSIRLDSSAHNRWVTGKNHWAKQSVDLDDTHRAVHAKLEAYCARLALIHHTVSIATQPSLHKTSIGEVSLEAAITLTEWFRREAFRVIALLGETPKERQNRDLIKLIERCGGVIRPRDLQRCKSYPSVEKARADLQRLVDAGLAAR